MDGNMSFDEFSLEKKYDMVMKLLELSDVGLWTLESFDGKEKKLYVNDMMRRLLGASRDATPEECYKLWFSHVPDESVSLVNGCISDIVNSGQAGVSYSWNHPEWGSIYVGFGGVLVCSDEKGMKISGYFHNMKETNESLKKNEILKWEKDGYELMFGFISDYAKDLSLVMNDGGIVRLLKDACTHIGADRIYMFRKNGDVFACEALWCQKCMDSSNYENLVLSRNNSVFVSDMFCKSKSIMLNSHAEIIATFPKLYEALEGVEIKKLIAVPFYEDNQLAGFIGIDNPPKEKNYDAAKYLSVLGTFIELFLKKSNF